jgi:hypothetical protein
LSEELIAAATRGDIDLIRQRLDEGSDPDQRDERGATALHQAVAAQQLDAAAFLLAHGADPTVANNDGQRPLDADFCRTDTLHGIRQRYHRRTFHRDTASGSSPLAARWAADLERDGIVKVSGLIPPDVLATMREEFETFARRLEAKAANGEGRRRHYDEEEHVWPEEQAYVTNNAFKYSNALTRFCADDTLVEAARRYVGAEPSIQRALAMRYLPCTVAETDMFGWHHDMEEKRCKVMILLTDVGEQDQAMSYVIGSHKLFHPYLMFVRNPCRLDYCRKHMEDITIFNAYGEAGDVFLFDTNGAHRGNRRESAAIRDVYLVEYSADQSNVWGGDIDPDVFGDLRADAAKPFERMLSAPKRWSRPLTNRAPHWVATLPQIDSWL